MRWGRQPLTFIVWHSAFGILARWAERAVAGAETSCKEDTEKEFGGNHGRWIGKEWATMLPKRGKALVQKRVGKEPTIAKVEEVATQSMDTYGQQHDDVQITKHGKVQIRVFSDSELFDGGKRQWVLFSQKGCQSVSLHQTLKDCLPTGMTVDYIGDPDATGMCYMVQTGTEEAMKQQLDKCNNILPEDIALESDSKVKIDHDAQHVDNAMLVESEEPIGDDFWGLDRIDDRKMRDHDYSPPATGKGVHVFVADTGVRTTHTDFGGRAFPALEVRKPLKECDEKDTSCAADWEGHGTHSAAIIGGIKSGAAKDAKLYSVKIQTSSDPVPKHDYLQWPASLIVALEWTVIQWSKRPAVFSASYGFSGRHDSLQTAVDAATNQNVVVVVSAGNDNADACAYGPANIPSAITVGAMNKKNQRSGFSNYGKCVDIFAPGEAIVSADVFGDSDSRFNVRSGTSMACPFVSGAASLLLEEHRKSNGAYPAANKVTEMLLAAATVDRLTHVNGSPNRLLYVGGKDIVVTIGRSTSNKKCVTVSEGTHCEQNAGNPGKRVNPGYTTTKFKIYGTWNRICAQRIDWWSGWHFNLKVKCTSRIQTETVGRT